MKALYGFKNLSLPHLLGVLSMLILTLLSVIYYVERTTFVDNPFQIFLMIQDQDIAVMAGRYPSVIVRLLPFLVMKLGGSISLMMLSFSLSYMIFHVLIYYLIAFRFERPAIALAIPLMLAVSNSDGFYWCNSELIQAISAVVLAYAIFKSRWNDFSRISMALALVVLSMFFHPLSVVLLSYIFGYEIFCNRDKILSFAVLAFSIVVFLLKKSLLPNWYDTMKQEEFDANWNTYISDIIEIPSLNMFLSMDHVPIILLLLGLSCIVLLRSKSYFKIAITLGAFLLYLILVSISAPFAKYMFYTEVNHTPLVIIALWPLLISLDSYFQKLLYVALFIFMIVGLGSIIWRAGFYEARYDYYHEQLASMPDDRYYVSKDNIDMEKIVMIWASPYESLIISAREGKSKTLYISEKEKVIIKDKPLQFIGAFKEYDLLNLEYFDLSVKNYQPYIPD